MAGRRLGLIRVVVKTHGELRHRHRIDIASQSAKGRVTKARSRTSERVVVSGSLGIQSYLLGFGTTGPSKPT